jgi:hypothetical protein
VEREEQEVEGVAQEEVGVGVEEGVPGDQSGVDGARVVRVEVLPHRDNAWDLCFHTCRRQGRIG